MIFPYLIWCFFMVSGWLLQSNIKQLLHWQQKTMGMFDYEPWANEPPLYGCIHYLLQSTIINYNDSFELPRTKELVLYWSIAATKLWAKHISFTKPIWKVFNSFPKIQLTKGPTNRPTNGQSHMHVICIRITETTTAHFDMLLQSCYTLDWVTYISLQAAGARN